MRWSIEAMPEQWVARRKDRKPNLFMGYPMDAASSVPIGASGGGADSTSRPEDDEDPRPSLQCNREKWKNFGHLRASPQWTNGPLTRHAWSGLKHGIVQSRHPPRIGLLRRFATFVRDTCFLNLLAERPLFTLILLTGRITLS